MTNLTAEIWNLCIRIEGVAEDGVLDGLHGVWSGVSKWYQGSMCSF